MIDVTNLSRGLSEAQLAELRDLEIRHDFMQEQQRLTEERRRAVAAAYTDVLADARSQATKLVKAARPTVEKLMATMAEVGELLTAVQTCRIAVNAENPEGRRDFHGSRFTVEQFIRYVASAGQPIDSLDLTGGQRDIQPRRDGMVRGDIQQLIEDSRRVRAG